MRFPVLRIHVRTARRCFATVAKSQTIPQTVIEKVVQKYAVGLPEGKVVKAGDYVMIKPEHVMTHDNTGPVISKLPFFEISHTSALTLDLQIQIDWRTANSQTSSACIYPRSRRSKS